MGRINAQSIGQQPGGRTNGYDRKQGIITGGSEVEEACDSPNGPKQPNGREAEEARATEGIPLVMPVIEELRDISSRTGIAFD